uniref:EGF-like domain-containing protein n=1 Tax=Ornithorhynchus anatinus TaxID=9258 RepID=A0A6I8P085_ORNAN
MAWTSRELSGVSPTSTTPPSRPEPATPLPGTTSAAAPEPTEGSTVPPGSSDGSGRSCGPMGGPDAGDHRPDADPATLRCWTDADPTTPSSSSDADHRAPRPRPDAWPKGPGAAEQTLPPTRHTGPPGSERTSDDHSVLPGLSTAATATLHPQTGMGTPRPTLDPRPGPLGTTASPGPGSGPGLMPTQPPPTSLPTPPEQARSTPPPASTPHPKTRPPTPTSPPVPAPPRSGPPPAMSATSVSPEPVSGIRSSPPPGTLASETSPALGLGAVSTVRGSLVEPSLTPPLRPATPSAQHPSPLPTASEETHDPLAFTTMGTPASPPPPTTEGPPTLTMVPTDPRTPPVRTTLTPRPTPTLPSGIPRVAPTPRATPGHPPPPTRPEIPTPMPTAQTPAPSASPRPQTQTPPSPSTPHDPGARGPGGHTPAPGAPDMPPAPLTTESIPTGTAPPPSKAETSPPSPTGASTALDTERAWCLSNPCPAPALCSPTQGGFICSCPAGYQMEEGLCRLVRAFVGIVRLSSENGSAGPGPGPGAPSGLRRLEEEVRTLLMDLLTPMPGFASCTVRVTREPGGMNVVWVQASFSLASSVTVFKLAELMRAAAASSCQPSAPARAPDHYCHRLSLLGQIFQPGSLCRSKSPACDRETAACSDVDGLPLCRCRDGYFQISEMDHSCRACEDGFRLENQTCVRYGGAPTPPHQTTPPIPPKPLHCPHPSPGVFSWSGGWVVSPRL